MKSVINLTSLLPLTLLIGVHSSVAEETGDAAQTLPLVITEESQTASDAEQEQPVTELQPVEEARSDRNDNASLPTDQPDPQAADANQSPQTVNQQLEKLIADKAYEQAFTLGSTHLNEMEGDAVFDFHYGFAAAQLGQYNDALFPFERLVASYPSVLRYRLELARTYFYLGNADAAEEQFQIVRKANPPANVTATIDRFLQRIEQQRLAFQPSWSAMVGTAAGYDTNFNSATSIEQVDIYDGVFRAIIDKDDRKKASGYYQLRGMTSYISPLSMRSAWDIQLGASRKDNAADDIYDLDNLFASAGLRLVRNQHQFRVSARVSQYWLGDQSLLNELSASGEWRYDLQPVQLRTTLSLRQQDNELNDDLDLLTPELQVSANYFSAGYSLQSALSVSSDQGDADYQARDAISLSLGAQFLTGSAGTLYSTLLLRKYDFQGEYPDENAFAGGQTRDERMLQLSLGYSHSLRSWLSLYTQVAYIDYDSNIDLYEYDRTLTEAGLNLAF